MMSLQQLHFFDCVAAVWQTAQSDGEVVVTGWVTVMKSSRIRGWPKSWGSIEVIAVIDRIQEGM